MSLSAAAEFLEANELMEIEFAFNKLLLSENGAARALLLGNVFWKKLDGAELHEAELF